VLPVAHVDHANAFYRSAAFREDIDYALGDDFRVVQFTPPGSEASIVSGNRLSPAYEVPGPDPAGRDDASFARFCDPGRQRLGHPGGEGRAPGS
jgi:hypothetical protein